MNRSIKLLTYLVVALLMVPALAFSVPSISSISPAVTPANTGATVDILGTGFGTMSDRVYFPSNNNSFTTPTAVIPGGVRVRVPATWSGDIVIRDGSTGSLSNAVAHEITFSWAAREWFTLPLTWKINSAGAPGVTYAETRTALEKGYDAWNCASGSSTTYGGSTSLAVTANDGTNCRYWRNTGWGSGTIAVCTTYYYTATGEIVETDIGFNSQYFDWAVDGDASSMDVGHIGTHEEGHSLGLLDMYGSADSEKTMYGWSSDGSTHARTLRSEDAMGMEFIYPNSRANLKDVVRSGWSAALVARNASSSSGTYCPLPTALSGTGTTYLNGSIVNSGGDCAAPSSLSRMYIDDVYRYWMTWSGVLGTGAEFSWTNLGINALNGRHTMSLDTDFNEEILESAEWDNLFKQQYVWAPYVLSHNIAVARSAPPVRGSLSYVNCDGFEFSTGGDWWAVVGTLGSNSDDDNDLRLHSTTPLADSGFENSEATSAYGGDAVDFVLVNGNIVGGSDVTRWVGLNRWSGGNSGAYVHMCRNLGTVFAPVLTPTYTMDAYEIVSMHEVNIGDTGNWQFTLDVQGGDANVGFALYDRGGAYFGRSGNMAQSNGSINGADEVFTVEITETGYYGLVVFKSNTDDLVDTSTYQIDIRMTPPNLTTLADTGWQYPVVVRNDDTAASGNAQVSALLDGNTASTYVSISGVNDGPNPAASAPTRVYVDDIYSWWVNWGAINAGQEFKYFNLGPLSVRGGRHTVEWRIDWDNVVEETNEVDNNFSRQFIWSPRLLLEETPLVEASPPVADGAGVYKNNVAFSLSPTHDYAWVTAMAATGGGEDYDLVVYNNYTGAESGLTIGFQSSQLVSDFTEYVGGSYQTANVTRYPSVIRWSGGASNFIIDASSSESRVFNSAPASWPGNNLPANRLVDIFEVSLEAGTTYAMEMINLTGEANLNVFAHSPTSVSLAPALSEFAWIAGGEGDDEGGWFEPTESGYYVFIVTKGGPTDIPRNASYNLSVFEGNSAVPEQEQAIPTTFALSGNFPNPFNPTTEIRFAVPAPGNRVRLDVFDLNGRLVRRLLDEQTGPGRHSVFWDGRNDQGGRVASGAYFYRLTAGSFTATEKMTLVK